MSNVISFIGTCGRDAEVRYLPSGAAVLSVSCANNVGFGDRQQALWFNVTVWGKRAESNLKDYLKKGQQVFVSGELTQREYKANDGTTKTSLELNASIIDLVGGKKPNDSQTGQESYSAPASRAPNPAPAQQASGSHDNFDAPYDDDIPF